ncbi:MAG: hypothetical protein WAL22_11910 [Solirubrobacteraceae bacterium]
MAASAALIAVLRIWSAVLEVTPLLAAAELVELVELLELLELLDRLELLPQADTATAATTATATADVVLLIEVNLFGAGLLVRLDITRPFVAVVTRPPIYPAPRP